MGFNQETVAGDLYRELPDQINAMYLKAGANLKSRLRVEVEWMYVSFLGFWLPVVVDDLAGEKRTYRRVNAVILMQKNQYHLLKIGYEIRNEDLVNITNEDNDRILLVSIFPDGNNVTIISGNLNTRVRLEGAGGYLYKAVIHPKLFIEAVDVHRPEVETFTLQSAYTRNSDGSIQEVLESAGFFRGSKLAEFATKGRFWIDRWELNPQLRHGDWLKLRFGQKQFAASKYDFNLSFKPEWVNQQVRIGFDSEGVPFVAIMAPNLSRANIKNVLPLVRIGAIDKRTRKWTSIDACLNTVPIDRIERAIHWSKDNNSSIVLTRLPVQLTEGVFRYGLIEVQLTDQIIREWREWEKSIPVGTRLSVRLIFNEYKFLKRRLIPEQIIIGYYGSDNPNVDQYLEFNELRIYAIHLDKNSRAYIQPNFHLLPEFIQREFNNKDLERSLKLMLFWDRVRVIQQDRGLSDDQVAKGLGILAWEYRQLQTRSMQHMRHVWFLSPLASVLDVDPVTLLCGESIESLRQTVSYGTFMRIQRVRRNMRLVDMAMKLKLATTIFEEMDEDILANILGEIELEKNIPAADIYVLIEKLYSVEGLLPKVKEQRTELKFPIDPRLVQKVGNYILTGDKTTTGLAVDEGPYSFKATPGIAKRLGGVNLWIPEDPRHTDQQDYVFVVREYPIIGEVFAIYAKISNQHMPQNIKQTPIIVYPAGLDRQQGIKLSHFYLIRALRNQDVPLYWSSTIVKVYAFTDEYLAFDLYAGEETKRITISKRLAAIKGLQAGGMIRLRAIKSPNGAMSVTVHALGKNEKVKHTLVTVLIPKPLGISKGGSIHRVSEPQRRIMPSLDENWRRDLASAESINDEDSFGLWQLMVEGEDWAYEQLAKSFYPDIERYVGKHAKYGFKDIEGNTWEDNLRLSGVHIVVKALTDFKKELGIPIRKFVVAALEIKIKSETQRMLRNTGQVSLDAPIFSSSGGGDEPVWLDRINSEQTLMRMGYTEDEIGNESIDDDNGHDLDSKEGAAFSQHDWQSISSTPQEAPVIFAGLSEDWLEGLIDQLIKKHGDRDVAIFKARYLEGRDFEDIGVEQVLGRKTVEHIITAVLETARQLMRK